MSSWKIERVREGSVTEALKLLYSDLNATDARTQVELIEQRLEAGTADARAMVWALEQTPDDGTVAIGVCWIEVQAGNVGYLHPPVINHWRTEREQCAQELYQAAEAAALDAGVNWVQCLLNPGAATSELLRKLGFSRISTLVYQAALLPQKNAAATPLRINARPYETNQRMQFEELLAATYEGSLDCPALNGTRTPGDTLHSYETIGQSGTEHWQFIERGETSIGCLLLGTHAPEAPTAKPLGELIYWGVIPSERGQGFGREILRLALSRAEELKLDKLVLAVDQANEPALRLYAQCGFFEWLRREAWGKQLRQ